MKADISPSPDMTTVCVLDVFSECGTGHGQAYYCNGCALGCSLGVTYKNVLDKGDGTDCAFYKSHTAEWSASRYLSARANIRPRKRC